MKRKSSLILVIFSTLLIFSSFDAVMSSTDAEVQDQVTTFLTKVAGLDEDGLSFSSFNASRNNLTGSNIPQITINAIIKNNNQEFTLTAKIVNEKIVFYVLDSLQGSIDNDEKFSIENSLNGVKKSLQAYETNFGATYVREFEQAIPTSLTNNEYSIEKQNARLEISYSDSSENTAEYASFLWVQKIGDIEVPNLSITLTVDKNGIVTRFFDNTELYKVVIADNLISEKEATNIGEEFIQKYCEENDREIASTESKLSYVRDLKSKRGDTYTIYPQWTISAEFEDVSKEGVYGYAVLIWADTGEVHHNAEQGMFQPVDTESTPSTAYLMMAGIAITIIILAIVIFSQKRKGFSKKQR